MYTQHELDSQKRRIEAIEDRLDQDYPGWRDDKPVLDFNVNGSIHDRTAAHAARLRQIEEFVFNSKQEDEERNID